MNQIHWLIEATKAFKDIKKNIESIGLHAKRSVPSTPDMFPMCQNHICSHRGQIMDG